MNIYEDTNYLLHRGLIKLLQIKDSYIRILTLHQCRDAVDKGIHIGGAFSVVVPLVSLFYSGIMRLYVDDPTKRGQDMFVLSKGHAVAPMASIYADLGYFEKSILRNSRSEDSILNGHPGPILPGVHVSTGPLGQGLGVAQGFAIIGKMSPNFDVYCVTGDGELQEGPIWEAIMYASYKKLDNLCVIIDKNAGQLDDTKQLIFPLLNFEQRLASFGWQVLNIDATQYSPVVKAFQQFKYANRGGQPTAIICRTRKGMGGFSSFMVNHKVEIPDDLMKQELDLQQARQNDRMNDFIRFIDELEKNGAYKKVTNRIKMIADQMNLKIEIKSKGQTSIGFKRMKVKIKRAPIRDKRIKFEPKKLPLLSTSEKYSCSNIVSAAMKIFAKDPRVICIDADLASTSGLEDGVGYVDMRRALNVGVAEANMMNIGEAFAAMGFNTWVSTFCPFFDWKVLRRIAIGYQERLEASKIKGGWLNKGHGLDLTFLATAPNLETKTNGATHMGNDDIMVFKGIAHLKIIDVSCPNQLIGIMKWIMEGNRGLIYLRIMRSSSSVLYGSNFRFEYGKGYALKESSKDQAVVISSGRGVHEALAAANDLQKSGISVAVIDMPSIDEKLLIDLYDSGKSLFIVEQNNGFIWSEFKNCIFRAKEEINTSRLFAVNTSDRSERPQFIHSATYEQLVDKFGLSYSKIARRIIENMQNN